MGHLYLLQLSDKNITYLFKNTNIQITFCTSNTIHDILKTQTNNTNTYMHSGIYQLQYHTCHLSYLGQTGQCLEQRYKECIRYITSSNPQSAYALYILHSKHKYGPMNVTLSLTPPRPQTFMYELVRKSLHSCFPTI